MCRKLFEKLSAQGCLYYVLSDDAILPEKKIFEN